MKKISALLLCMLLFSGCITIGRDFISDRVEKVSNGKTTKLDLVNMFGKPFRKGIDNGNETWTYIFNRYEVFGTTLSKDLYIVFDEDGKVISYTYNTTETSPGS